MREHRLLRELLLFGSPFVVLLSLCIAGIATANFHVRVVAEGVAAAIIVFSLSWIWVERKRIAHVLSPLVLLALSFLSMAWLLKTYFMSWFEWALWYAPCVILMCFVAEALSYYAERRNLAAAQVSMGSLLLLMSLSAVLLTVVAKLGSLRASGDLAWLWLVDALVFIVPVSLVGTGIFWSVRFRRPLFAIALVLAAPWLGFLICNIYGYTFFESIVAPISVSAVTILLLSYSSTMVNDRFPIRTQTH